MWARHASLTIAVAIAACKTTAGGDRALLRDGVDASAAPSASAWPSASVGSPEAGTAPPSDADAVRIDCTADAAWARAIKSERQFREIFLPDTPAVTFVWRIRNRHKSTRFPDDAEYPAAYVQNVELAFEPGPLGPAIPLGELSGYVEPYDVTYCRGRAFRLPPNAEWNFPVEPSVAAAFSLGTPQGATRYMLVRDGDVLHLLHVETSDGRCDDVKQGPLLACKGALYARTADIHIPHRASLHERIDNLGSPLACSVRDLEHSEPLLPPL
jgi:hypothetical protein